MSVYVTSCVCVCIIKTTKNISVEIRARETRACTTRLYKIVVANVILFHTENSDVTAVAMNNRMYYFFYVSNL